ncbi:alpha/beta fold hydrolase [Frigoribacterium sp. 2-23]|uniref:alpha/beta fold hydrolase n=1 Tax=Frigoribacterium sp. 2-23 TaxID=3415006 RepID=UPI003C6EC543
MPESRVDVIDLLASPTVPGPIASVLDQFANVVRAVPDTVAVSDEHGALTYAELDRLTTALVPVLDRELPPGDSPVGAFVSHDRKAVVLAVAVMKSGRPLVILDQHLPAARLAHIVEIGGLRGIITDRRIDREAGAPAELIDTGAELLSWHDLESQATALSDAEVEAVDLGRVAAQPGSQMTFVVFTSGSTGKPKGVIVTHDQMMNDMVHMLEHFDVSTGDRNAVVSPLSFAAGIFFCWASLCIGATVHVYDPREHPIGEFVSTIREHGLTGMLCTPYLVRALSAALAPGEVLDTLRSVTTVGEAIMGQDVRTLLGHLPPTASFFNGTGSSEIGGFAAHRIRSGEVVPDGVVPAGKPGTNKEVRLVDENGAPVAQGETGEILVVSDYMSPGYLNDEVQTAMRFGRDADGRPTVHQGDLGRFDENGDLVLLGRADSAVKVRGYLVEPGEIEGALLTMTDVTEAVVIPLVAPPAATTLVAYVVADARLRPPSPAELRRRLRAVLPEYMVPAHIVQLAALPINERGKIDRQQLPPVAARTPVDEEQDVRQQVMAGIWGETLGLTDVALDDDFMALGGDSLTAEEMLAAVHDRFDVDLPSTQLLEYPTLREFTERVTTSTKALPSHPDVVTLRSGGTGTPVFAFAGAGALALTFLPLSRHIENRSVYAFQAHGLEQRAWPDWSVEAAARRYIEIIRVIQPKGPYLLVGHSFGGLVALEIADQLVAGGQEVELVTLLDTFLPRSAEEMPQLEFAKLAPRAPSAAPSPLARVAGGIAGVVRKPVERLLPDGLPAVGQLGERVRARMAGVIPFDGQRQFDAFFDHATLAGRKYRIKPYAGRVLFLFAEGNPDGADAWRRLVTGRIDFVEIAAEHSSVLREPHATELAAILTKAFETP